MNEHKLSSSERKHLSKGTFVFQKDRRYPIPDESHARNALSRVSQNGNSGEKAKVRAAVHKKFPGIKVSEGRQRAIEIVDQMLSRETPIGECDERIAEIKRELKLANKEVQ